MKLEGSFIGNKCFVQLAYLSLPPNCTFFVAAVASVYPGKTEKKNKKKHKRKKKKKSHTMLCRILMIHTNYTDAGFYITIHSR